MRYCAPRAAVQYCDGEIRYLINAAELITPEFATISRTACVVTTSTDYKALPSHVRDAAVVARQLDDSRETDESVATEHVNSL